MEWKKLSGSMLGVYIHIPFCKNICNYCDFCKVYYKTGYVSKYLDSLELEIEIRVTEISGVRVEPSNAAGCQQHKAGRNCHKAVFLTVCHGSVAGCTIRQEIQHFGVFHQRDIRLSADSL